MVLPHPGRLMTSDRQQQTGRNTTTATSPAVVFYHKHQLFGTSESHRRRDFGAKNIDQEFTSLAFRV
ncbi:hypothetical protein RRG08_055046 [Elysia crispata]|uniref:Uncharacterized protein n=1 Tax=Elysia crispata TaxID=231223 RepID=A0AAE1AZW5_9GAST|nr:hypothetical protein RRG08_055046 [Elysia crispata]